MAANPPILDAGRERQQQVGLVHKLRTLQALQTANLALQRDQIDRLEADLLALRGDYLRLHDAAANLAMELDDGAILADDDQELLDALNAAVVDSIGYMQAQEARGHG